MEGGGLRLRQRGKWEAIESGNREGTAGGDRQSRCSKVERKELSGFVVGHPASRVTMVLTQVDG